MLFAGMLAHCGVDKAMKIVHGLASRPLPSSLPSLPCHYALMVNDDRKHLEGVDVCDESSFDE
jgi:hypothetical protein